ncbi:hypothetical protein D9M70_540710 [compost metagenome]
MASTSWRPRLAAASVWSAAVALSWALRATSWTLAAICSMALATCSVSLCCWRVAWLLLATEVASWVACSANCRADSLMRPTTAPASVSSMRRAKASSPNSSLRPQ